MRNVVTIETVHGYVDVRIPVRVDEVGAEQEYIEELMFNEHGLEPCIYCGTFCEHGAEHCAEEGL